jgi:hypothetical protein
MHLKCHVASNQIAFCVVGEMLHMLGAMRATNLPESCGVWFHLILITHSRYLHKKTGDETHIDLIDSR